MLRRKAEKVLEDWKGTPGHKPLIVKGCRQRGKIFSVRAFVEKSYRCVVYLNFLVRSYEDDMCKCALRADKANIRQCFRSTPRQLGKGNKKFQYSAVRKGTTASKFAGSLQRIEDAGIISRCYNLTLPELPLDGNAIDDVFKVYIRDMGLFVSMLEDGTRYDILRGNLFGYKGAIFENLVADFFTKMGRKLYHYRKNSGLEIAFVIRWRGACTLVEAKPSTVNAKSVKTVLNGPAKYRGHQARRLQRGQGGPDTDSADVHELFAQRGVRELL